MVKAPEGNPEREERELPLIAITMGDPAGVGPEIIMRVLSKADIHEYCRPVVLGDAFALSLAQEILSTELKINVVSMPWEAESVPGSVDVLAVSQLVRRDLQPGHPTVEAGRAMAKYIVKAVEMTKKKVFAAMVTCPINKALLQSAGYSYEGHTQLIAFLTNTDDYVMMLAGKILRVALVTIHCPIRQVPDALRVEGVYKTIAITSEALRKDFGCLNPYVAVAGLNPHCGEGGLFGSEEREIIAPAVSRAKQAGIRVEGPLPADTLFAKAASGRFDAVVAMYHDQGLIPLKMLHFSDAVNVTLGLPIIRTSVDHGTAYDIAGKGEANPSSLLAAVRMAAQMAQRRKASRFGRSK